MLLTNLLRYSILIFNLFLLISCDNNQQKIQGDIWRLTSKIDSIVSKYQFNGNILISNDTNILYSKTIGFSDIENQVIMNLDNQFVIGSISKQITAVLVLREYEKGKIGLNDTIDQYLNKVNQAWVKKVTIHHLLTHTHGIVNINSPLEFKPGSRFQYSQLGYDLLAQILETVSGKTFQKLSTELFKQCEMRSTFHPDNKAYRHLVKAYQENENGILELAENSLYNYAAAGSFISTVKDLTKWNQLLHSEKLVKKETLELMKTRYATRVHPIFETIEYGYGLLFKDGEENTKIGALGYAPGFVSSCYFYPKTNLNLVILENTAKSLDDFRRTFAVHTEIMDLIKNEATIVTTND